MIEASSAVEEKMAYLTRIRDKKVAFQFCIMYSVYHIFLQVTLIYFNALYKNCNEIVLSHRDRIDPCSDSESEADSPKSVRSRSNGNRKPI